MVRSSVVFAAILLLAVPATALPEEEVSLRPFSGLGPVSVLVEKVHDDDRAAGVSESYLQNVAETELRRAGIELRPHPFKHFVYVRVNTVQAPGGVVLGTIEVALGRTVRLEDDTPVLARVWQRSTFLAAEPGKYKSGARAELLKLLETFEALYAQARARSRSE